MLDAATNFARDADQNELIGNFNLTAMQQAGVQTGGFDAQAYTDMIVGPLHLPRLLTANGFEPVFPMTTFDIDLLQLDLAEPSGFAPNDGFVFAPVEKRTFPKRMGETRQVLNDGFAANPMFVPLTAAEFEFQAGEINAILDPSLSSVLHYKGEPIGTIICIPDLNGFLAATRSRIGILTPFHYLRYRLNRKRAVIIFYSVATAWHGRGVMRAMLTRTVIGLRIERAIGHVKHGAPWLWQAVDAISYFGMTRGAAQIGNMNLGTAHRRNIAECHTERQSRAGLSHAVWQAEDLRAGQKSETGKDAVECSHQNLGRRVARAFIKHQCSGDDPLRHRIAGERIGADPAKARSGKGGSTARLGTCGPRYGWA